MVGSNMACVNLAGASDRRGRTKRMGALSMTLLNSSCRWEYCLHCRCIFVAKHEILAASSSVVWSVVQRHVCYMIYTRILLSVSAPAIVRTACVSLLHGCRHVGASRMMIQTARDLFAVHVKSTSGAFRTMTYAAGIFLVTWPRG